MYFEWPQFQRCCFCMPLRKGVLLLAYLQILFITFMIGMYSYTMKSMGQAYLIYHGTVVPLRGEVCIFIYCVEFMFGALLIFAAHKKSVMLLKVYYYFAVVTILTTFVIQIAAMASMRYWEVIFEIALFGFTGMIVQLYLILLVWSLLKKLESDESHVYEKKLHQIVDGQVKAQTIPSNGVFKPSTTSCEDV